MIAGLLPTLARDLNVGLPAGHLITAFSLAYAVGAPVMAVLTARLVRRPLRIPNSSPSPPDRDPG